MRGGAALHGRKGGGAMPRGKRAYRVLLWAVLAALLALAVRRSQWKSFAAMAASGVVCSLFFGQSFLVEQVLRSNYFDTYSAYDQVFFLREFF